VRGEMGDGRWEMGDGRGGDSLNPIDHTLCFGGEWGRVGGGGVIAAIGGHGTSAWGEI